jgi:hypothetical protein
MSSLPLDFRYVETFLKNLGVRITLEPGEYFVIRRDFIGLGPMRERRGIDDLRDAFIYGLELALLPSIYRSYYRRPPKYGHNARAHKIRQQQVEARRHEIEAEKAAAAARREVLIRKELLKLGASVK